MKFIKKHKQEFILLAIILFILLACGIAFLVMWFSGNGDKYGDRLDGIESYSMSSNYLGDKVSILKDVNHVLSVDYNVEGRLVSFIIKVEDDTDIEDAKKVGDIIIKNFKEEELSYYDFQVYLTDSGASLKAYEEDTEDKVKLVYPAIGYKHKTSDSFVW